MSEVRFNVGDAELRSALDVLAGIDGAAAEAVRSALNDTLNSEKTDLARRIRQKLNLNYREIRERIAITGRPSKDSPTGTLTVDHRDVPLEDFKAKFRAKSGAGVVVTTVKGKGAEVFKHMFRATMHGARGGTHPGIFEREVFTPKNAPAKGRYTMASRLARQAAAPHKAGRKLRTLQKIVARQSIKEKFGPAVVTAVEETPGMIDAVLEDTAEKFEKRLLSKIDFQLAKASKAQGHG
jgi:hypothetical protein